MAAFNIITCIYDCTSYVGDRIFSFFSTIIWNLAGFDQYYVFQDNCPTPIPYRAFMLGGTGRYKWYYNTRTREFEAWIQGAKREYLPALSISIRQDYEDEEGPNNRYEYDLTGWLDTVRFKTVPNFFPHPMQIVAAWSLHSGVWPSFVERDNKHTRISMLSGMDGDIHDVDVSTTISRFRWRDFIGAAESEESEGESEESEGESEESVAESEQPLESDMSKSATSASEDENTECKQLVSDKALFLAGRTDEIPTWTNDWAIMPCSIATFMSTLSMYDQIGLPPVDGYIPTVNPDMEAVD